MPANVDLELYTVGQAIDNFGFGRFQMYLSLMVGFANIADAMEMMILSILAPALHCQWHITQSQQAFLTTVVFLGMMISSPLWGKLADSFGRRPTLIWTSFFLCYFGLLTSIAPSFHWVLFLRFLVGIFIGGVPQACTLYAEYLPSSARGKAIMVLSFFWALGACLLAFLAWLVMPTFGWRYLVALSTIPLLLFLTFSRYLPESPMYLAVTGKKREVQEILDNIAKMNEKRRVHGNLVLDEETTAGQRGQFLDLFRKGQARLSVMVFFLWFVAAFSYYGVVLLSTELLNSSHDTCAASGASTIDGIPGEAQCSVHICSGLKNEDYVELIKTSLAEFPGTILALILIDRIGRRRTLAVNGILFALCSLVVIECTLSKNLLVVALFGARGFAAGFFQSVYVYTPEVFPTKLRAVALGFGSGFARIGAMITPFIAQVLLKTSLYSAMLLYAGLGLLAALVAWFLPVESSGQDLTQAVIQPKAENPDKARDKHDQLVDQMETNELEQARDNNNS